MSAPESSTVRSGQLFALLAFTFWGLSALFWPLLQPAGALEVLFHRVIWAFVFAALFVTLLRRWSRFRGLPLRTWLLIAAAGTLNLGNWGLFIFAVMNEQIVAASMGYFLNPIATAVIGMLILREKARVSRLIALGIGVIAVVVTGMNSGGNPILPLLMATCFGFYGLVQRVIPLGPLETLTGESAVLTPLMIVAVVMLHLDGSATLFSFGPGHTVLFVLGGLVTLLPLLAFGAAARRVPLSTMAVMQYISPMIQFLIGVYIAHEVMPAARWVGFLLIVVAVLVFTIGEFWRPRRRYPAGTTPSG